MPKSLSLIIIVLFLVVPSTVSAETYPLCEFPEYNGDAEIFFEVYTDTRLYNDSVLEGSNPLGGIKFEIGFPNYVLNDGSYFTDNVKKVVFRNLETKNAYVIRSPFLIDIDGLPYAEYAIWNADPAILIGKWRAIVVMNDGTRYRESFEIFDSDIQQPKPKPVQNIDFTTIDIGRLVTFTAPEFENKVFVFRIFKDPQDDDPEDIIIDHQQRKLDADSNQIAFLIPPEYTNTVRARIETRDNGVDWLWYDHETCEIKRRGKRGRSLVWFEIPDASNSE